MGFVERNIRASMTRMERRTTTMNAKQIVTDDDTTFDELQPHLELLLVYEDVPTALRAKHAVDNVLNGMEAPARHHIHAWKLDLLHQAECFYGQAINDALAADIVVLSTHGNNGVPLEVMSRLMQWVGLKRETPCALIISVDPGVKPSAEETPELVELCAAARRNNVTVISHAGEPLDATLGAALAETKSVVESQPHMFTSSSQGSLRPAPWGINE
jgi:hypothetical protein